MPSDSRPEDFIFKIKGFNTISNYNGRGVCLFIRDHIEYDQVFEYDKFFKTSIFINLKKYQYNFTLGVLYRSPNTSKNEDNLMLEMINIIANKHMSLNNKLLLMGDFNFPGIDWSLENTKHQNNDNMENKFLSCIQKHFLYQLVEEKTHFRGDQNPTLIDLIITNDPKLFGEITFNAPIGKSHHSVISFELYINPVNNPNSNANCKVLGYGWSCR